MLHLDQVIPGSEEPKPAITPPHEYLLVGAIDVRNLPPNA